jgi:hypothetical protein
MLVYKCDGKLYSTGIKCENEVQNELPERWLSINGQIKNGLHDAHYIECNGLRHFCSRRCLENFLFKDVNPAGGITGTQNMNIDPNVKTEGTETEVEQTLEQADTEKGQDEVGQESEEG